MACWVPNHLPLRPSSFLLLLLLLVGHSLISSTDAHQHQSPFPSGREKQAHFHFFFHDTLSGSNPTAIRIVNPPPNAPRSFGTVMMVDNPLTETADPFSKLLGRAQGLYASACQTDIALMMSMNYFFLDGEFNGSTLVIFGRNPVMEGVREMSVVGGSGKLRMARGYALAHTRSLNVEGDAVVEYHVYVLYYDDVGAEKVVTTSTKSAGGGGGGGGVGGVTGAGTGIQSAVSAASAGNWSVVLAALAVSWGLFLSTRP